MPYINITKPANLKRERIFIQSNGKIFKGGADEYFNNKMGNELGRVKGTNKDNKGGKEIKK